MNSIHLNREYEENERGDLSAIHLCDLMYWALSNAFLMPIFVYFVLSNEQLWPIQAIKTAEHRKIKKVAKKLKVIITQVGVNDATSYSEHKNVNFISSK